MSYNTQAILTDVNGKPIPQYFDESADQFKPLLPEPIVVDYFEGTSNTNKTYIDNMRGISVNNDGVNNLTFTINSITRTIYAGEGYNGIFKDTFTQVSITATDKFRVEVLR